MFTTFSSSKRTAAPGEFRANIHQSCTASIVKISPEERKLALLAAKMMRLKVAGVAIIRAKSGRWLLEGSTSPSIEGRKTATGKDIAGMMIS